MSKLKDITGINYNRLKVISFNGRINNRSYWNCLCVCGNSTSVEGSNLKSGQVKSCGCLGREGGNNRKHGISSHKLYRVWESMKARCYNTNNDAYHNYGGRGIIVSKRWLTFENFIEDMIYEYEPGLTLERINTNGNYEKNNCLWDTYKQQARNKRNNKIIIYYGKEYLVPELAEIFNIDSKIIYRRLSKGWSPEKAIQTPIDIKKINFNKRKYND